MWWMRARGVSECSASARSLTTSIAADASEICDATAAVTRPPSTSVGSERIFSQFGSRRPPAHTRAVGRGARSLVEREAVERRDLVLEPSLGSGAQRALVRLDREGLHVLARDVPLLG